MKDIIPQGFLFTKVSMIEAKVLGFKKAGVDQLQLVLDFDRTLTVGTSKDKHDSTSWDILRSHLPAEGKERAEKIKQHYRTLELEGKLTPQQAVDWWTSSINLIIEYRLDMTDVEKDFLSKSTIRPGVKELFNFCARHNIPTIIMSAGIREVIEIWASVYEIRPTIILSTDLKLDTKRRIVGWDKKSLVHTLNKQEIGHPELSKIRVERPRTILVGDSIHDYNMAQGSENVFRVRILDPHDDKSEDPMLARQQTFELFDTAIEGGTLFPIVSLLQQIKE
jgi:HAD superfamily phosphoserine phosphatase-like hydrolase